MSRQSTAEEQEPIIIEENSSIVSTNDDLKELCILLDEERYKMHQLAEQWKQFGTSSVHNKFIQKYCDQFMKQFQKNVSTQTSLAKQESTLDVSIDDSLQRQISLQNMFDAIKTAEIYESIGNITGDDESGKNILKEFCNLIWKYLEEHSRPKSSCLL